MRCVGKDETAKMTYKHMLHHLPSVWRSQLKPFLHAEPNERNTARAEAKVAWSQFESSAKVSGTEDLADDMTFNRVQFLAWTGLWERLPDYEAGKKFDNLLQEQGGAHNDGEVEQVKYADIKKHENSQWHRTPLWCFTRHTHHRE